MLETPMLKRRLNPFLLASTVLILSLLAGLSVLYQGQLNELVTQKRDLSDNLSRQMEKVENLSHRNENLKAKLSNISEQRSNLKTELDAKTQKVDSLEEKVELLNTEIEQKNEDIEELRNQTELLNNSLETICVRHNNTLTEGSKTVCESRGFNP